jgi:hypothetical protein
MDDVLTKQENIFTTEQINPSLIEVEISLCRLLQLQEKIESLDEKTSILGLDAIDLEEFLANSALTDLITIDLLSDVSAYKSQIAEEIGFLKAKGAIVDLAESGKLSWLGQIDNQEVLLSWQLGDGCQVNYWRKKEEIFEKRKRLK